MAAMSRMDALGVMTSNLQARAKTDDAACTARNENDDDDIDDAGDGISHMGTPTALFLCKRSLSFTTMCSISLRHKKVSDVIVCVLGCCSARVSIADVYFGALQSMVATFLDGYNTTVIAYGQTGSGKTYTMGHSMDNSARQPGIAHVTASDGLMPRFLSDFFAALDQERSTERSTERSIRASFLEVYCDDIHDLLDERREKPQLIVREDVNSVYVENLTQIEVKSLEKALQVLNLGRLRQARGANALNDQSSRSHAVFTMEVTRKNGLETKKAKLTFVDLAGSERLKKTHVEGTRQKESMSINVGLLALGNVINALGDDKITHRKSDSNGQGPHVPYRSSKLTRLLRDALGGNSSTLFIACLSPVAANAGETLCTLQYANRARNIQNRAQKNVEVKTIPRTPSQIEINRLQEEILKLQRQLHEQGSPSSPCSTHSSHPPSPTEAPVVPISLTTMLFASKSDSIRSQNVTDIGLIGQQEVNEHNTSDNVLKPSDVLPPPQVQDFSLEAAPENTNAEEADVNQNGSTCPPSPIEEEIIESEMVMGDESVASCQLQMDEDTVMETVPKQKSLSTPDDSDDVSESREHEQDRLDECSGVSHNCEMSSAGHDGPEAAKLVSEPQDDQARDAQNEVMAAAECMHSPAIVQNERVSTLTADAMANGLAQTTSHLLEHDCEAPVESSTSDRNGGEAKVTGSVADETDVNVDGTFDSVCEDIINPLSVPLPSDLDDLDEFMDCEEDDGVVELFACHTMLQPRANDDDPRDPEVTQVIEQEAIHQAPNESGDSGLTNVSLPDDRTEIADAHASDQSAAATQASDFVYIPPPLLGCNRRPSVTTPQPNVNTVYQRPETPRRRGSATRPIKIIAFDDQVAASSQSSRTQRVDNLLERLRWLGEDQFGQLPALDCAEDSAIEKLLVTLEAVLSAHEKQNERLDRLERRWQRLLKTLGNKKSRAADRLGKFSASHRESFVRQQVTKCERKLAKNLYMRVLARQELDQLLEEASYDGHLDVDSTLFLSEEQLRICRGWKGGSSDCENFQKELLPLLLNGFLSASSDEVESERIALMQL
ncbi:TPA: hypothetical protein N0F65_009152 [Lagenidium giganteum]|uniref:Kinesin motor domain-containing protein n=1 Tax=Lagenidium giganteum TaxID=4803 RepID=A0AAV2YRR1_9STRA|nr:TPA: hypothetical protein N0F65_009152 [Lagenidium giganteum]